MAPEQIPFKFDDETAPKIQPKAVEGTRELAPNDECPACGNAYEDDGPGCNMCRVRKLEIRAKRQEKAS